MKTLIEAIAFGYKEAKLAKDTLTKEQFDRFLALLQANGNN